MFTSDLVKKFVHDYTFNIVHSTPYYAQANGQAEVTNKILKWNITKIVKENPKV